jgi:hypothetical protein
MVAGRRRAGRGLAACAALVLAAVVAPTAPAQAAGSACGGDVKFTLRAQDGSGRTTEARAYVCSSTTNPKHAALHLLVLASDFTKVTYRLELHSCVTGGGLTARNGTSEGGSGNHIIRNTNQVNYPYGVWAQARITSVYAVVDGRGYGGGGVFSSNSVVCTA